MTVTSRKQSQAWRRNHVLISEVDDAALLKAVRYQLAPVDATGMRVCDLGLILKAKRKVPHGRKGWLLAFLHRHADEFVLDDGTGNGHYIVATRADVQHGEEGGSTVAEDD